MWVPFPVQRISVASDQHKSQHEEALAKVRGLEAEMKKLRQEVEAKNAALAAAEAVRLAEDSQDATVGSSRRFGNRSACIQRIAWVGSDLMGLKGCGGLASLCERR